MKILIWQTLIVFLELLIKYKIDEIYNLAAQSFVKSSFQTPISTANITGLGVLRFLEVIRNSAKKIKFYQASSSEMIGNTKSLLQNENAIFNPKSPYAVAKIFGHYIVKNYRESYNIYACSGILFNHESPLRGEEFVTRKITKALSEIKMGSKKCLELGNLYAKRDWGYAKDYVEAMWLMLQQKNADDYVIGTGKSHSIKQFINQVCKNLDLKIKWVGKKEKERAINILNSKTIIRINKKYYRPSEVNFLKADFNKAKKIGMAFGLRPLSQINYSVNEISYLKATGDSILNNYKGDGGLNQLFFGVGKTWKNISFGFNTGVNFGRKNIETRKSFLYNTDSTHYYQSLSSTNTIYSGLFLNLGIQGEFAIKTVAGKISTDKTEYSISYGATYNLNQKFM
jgi:GDPmannose 4,6-dehydratase